MCHWICEKPSLPSRTRVLLAPGLARVKEWAYAGIFIDFSGAAVVGFLNGSAFHVTAPVILIGVLVVSWTCVRKAAYSPPPLVPAISGR